LQKRGLTLPLQAVSPEIRKRHFRGQSSVNRCTRDRYFFEQFGLAGLHSGIGPSSAFRIGVAIATYVQAKPTIRINILTARFMVFS
jgi:hypothetical protein